MNIPDIINKNTEAGDTKAENSLYIEDITPKIFTFLLSFSKLIS
ncbi:MAG: hypothetical protein ACFFC3_05325 [Candidatus Odinarchaeota archaeon]